MNNKIYLSETCKFLAIMAYVSGGVSALYFSLFPIFFGIELNENLIEIGDAHFVRVYVKMLISAVVYLVIYFVIGVILFRLSRRLERGQ